MTEKCISVKGEFKNPKWSQCHRSLVCVYKKDDSSQQCLIQTLHIYPINVMELYENWNDEALKNTILEIKNAPHVLHSTMGSKKDF